MHSKKKTSCATAGALQLTPKKKNRMARKHQQQEHPHPQEEKPQTPKEPKESAQQLSVNIYAHGFPAKGDDDAGLLHHFNPGVVPPTPPVNFMEEDTIRIPCVEFEDLQDSLVDKTLSTIPALIHSLESDQSTDNLNSRETSLDNIGTLHAVSKEAHFSLRQAKETWGHDSTPVNNDNPTTHTENKARPNKDKPHGNVTCDGAFSSIFKHKASISQNVLIQGPKSKSVDDAFNSVVIETQTKGNEKPTETNLSNGYFSSIFKHKGANKEKREKVLEDKTVEPCQTQKEKEPDNKKISTESVTALLCNESSTCSLEMPTGHPVGCALDAICFNESYTNSIGNILRTANFPVLFGKNGVNDASRGAQGETVGSLLAGKSIKKICNFTFTGPCALLHEDSNTINDLFGMQPTDETASCSSIQVKAELDYKKEVLPSRAQLAEGPKRRGRLRRCPQAESTPHASGDCSTVPPKAESTVDSSDVMRMTRSRRRLACLCDDLEELPPPKRVRKTAPTVTTPGPTTRASNKKNKSK